jgi:hypothetical protein
MANISLLLTHLLAIHRTAPVRGVTEAANLTWGEVYSPEGGLVLGSKQQSMFADPDFQYPKHQAEY